MKHLQDIIENILLGKTEFYINHLELQEQRYILKTLRICGFDIKGDDNHEHTEKVLWEGLFLNTGQTNGLVHTA